MILDKRNEFADAVALNTGAAGSYLIGDVIDLGSVRDVGNGEDIYIVAVVQTLATSGGAATLQLNLVTDDNAGMASPAVLVSSAAIAVASLTAGRVIMAICLPVEGNLYERYIGIQQVTGTAAFTAGKVDIFIVRDFTKWKAYADAIN